MLMFILSINQSAINLPPRDVLPINTRRTSCESKTSLLPCCFPHLFGYAFEVSALFIQFLFRCLVLRCVSLLFLFHYLLLQTRDPRIWESLLITFIMSILCLPAGERGLSFMWTFLILDIIVHYVKYLLLGWDFGLS